MMRDILRRYTPRHFNTEDRYTSGERGAFFEFHERSVGQRAKAPER